MPSNSYFYQIYQGQLLQMNRKFLELKKMIKLKEKKFIEAIQNYAHSVQNKLDQLEYQFTKMIEEMYNRFEETLIYDYSVSDDIMANLQSLKLDLNNRFTKIIKVIEKDKEFFNTYERIVQNMIDLKKFQNNFFLLEEKGLIQCDQNIAQYLCKFRIMQQSQLYQALKSQQPDSEKTLKEILMNSQLFPEEDIYKQFYQLAKILQKLQESGINVAKLKKSLVCFVTFNSKIHLKIQQFNVISKEKQQQIQQEVFYNRRYIPFNDKSVYIQSNETISSVKCFVKLISQFSKVFPNYLISQLNEYIQNDIDRYYVMSDILMLFQLLKFEKEIDYFHDISDNQNNIQTHNQLNIKQLDIQQQNQDMELLEKDDEEISLLQLITNSLNYNQVFDNI